MSRNFVVVQSRAQSSPLTEEPENSGLEIGRCRKMYAPAVQRSMWLAMLTMMKELRGRCMVEKQKGTLIVACGSLPIVMVLRLAA